MSELSSIPGAGSCGRDTALLLESVPAPRCGMRGGNAPVPPCRRLRAQIAGKEQEWSRKGKSEGEGLFRSCHEQSSSFGLLEVKTLLLFLTLTVLKYSVLSLVLSNCSLLQGTEKDFCGREDATTGNS